MTKTPRYFATLDGQTFTRNSDRTYTHVVVARKAHEWRYQVGPVAVTDTKYVVIGFCGRLELAEQLQRTTNTERIMMPGDKYAKPTRRTRVLQPICTGPVIWSDVTILPLTDTRA